MGNDLEIGDINAPIQLEMTRATIVILGELLENLTDKALLRKEIDAPQANALYYLENAIESVCADSFRPDYLKVLQEAKKSMGDGE